MKLFPKITLLLGGVVTIASVAGVAATWTYVGGNAEIEQNMLSVGLAEFSWEGSEVLPDDIAGEDHQALVESLVDGEHGMNAEGSVINQQIAERQNSWWSWDTFGSMDVYDSTDMTELFGLETSNLSFMIYFPDNAPNTRYIFTTSVELGEAGSWGNVDPNIPIGENVYAVYRTTLERNEAGDWVETKTELGYAESAYYDNNLLGSWVVQCPSFDVDTWTAGKLGTGMDNAVYAYVGQTVSAYVDTADETAYYEVTPEATGTRTATSANTACTITVYDRNGNELATSGPVEAEDGTQSVSVSWQAARNTRYYISVVGDTSMTFTIA